MRVLPDRRVSGGAFFTCLIRVMAVVMTSSNLSHAQNYPSKPIRIISGSAPGGSIDITARIVAKQFSESFGQPAFVDYRPGAGSTLGAEFVAKSSPDGYTVLLGSAAALCIAPAIYPGLRYDPPKDFSPVSTVVDSFAVLLVNSSVPAGSAKELISLAKSRASPLRFGSAGVGSHTHLAMELFKSMSGIMADHIPYKGQAPALQDLMGERTDMMMTPVVGIGQLAKQGKVKVLGYTSAKRSISMLDVPTIAESGLPGFQSSSWYGVLAPAGVPRDAVMKLNSAIVKSLGTDEMKDLLRKQGLEAVGNSPEEFAQLIKSELPKWAKVVRDSGAKFE